EPRSWMEGVAPDFPAGLSGCEPGVRINHLGLPAIAALLRRPIAARDVDQPGRRDFRQPESVRGESTAGAMPGIRGPGAALLDPGALPGAVRGQERGAGASIRAAARGDPRNRAIAALAGVSDRKDPAANGPHRNLLCATGTAAARDRRGESGRATG